MSRSITIEAGYHQRSELLFVGMSGFFHRLTRMKMSSAGSSRNSRFRFARGTPAIWYLNILRKLDSCTSITPRESPPLEAIRVESRSVLRGRIPPFQRCPRIRFAWAQFVSESRVPIESVEAGNQLCRAPSQSGALIGCISYRGRHRCFLRREFE